jgi:nucleoside-diphosphate-sugar epimerase
MTAVADAPALASAVAGDTIGSVAPCRVLVTGATGFLGTSLVQRLTGAGVPVRALVRTRTQAARFARVGVESVVGDVNDEDALTAAADGIVVLFHLAGKLLEPGESADDYRRTHVDGTRRVIDVALRQPHLRRFVHCSTTGVLGSTGTVRADERTPLSPGNVYEETKAEAELEVLAACEQGLPAVVARPGLVYGPGDLHLVSFFRAVLKRQFRPIGRAPVWLHPIYIDDMTQAFLRCAVSPDAIGECFHLAAPEPVSLEQLAGTIARSAGTRPAAGHIPLPAARLLAAAGDALPAVLRPRAPLTRSRLDFLTHSRVYSVSKAEQLLSFVAPTALDDGVARSVSWYRRHGYLPA